MSPEIPLGFLRSRSERRTGGVIEFWWSVALAALGVVVPGIAALYEFVVKGRKRIGYRVQMDTTRPTRNSAATTRRCD